MEVHIKKPTDKKAKTVAMLAALPPAIYDREYAEVGGAATYGGNDFSDIKVTIPEAGIIDGTIPIVDRAKYLGSMIDREPGGHPRGYCGIVHNTRPVFPPSYKSGDTGLHGPKQK